MVWDLYNDHVIAVMLKAWDTGFPVWPCETSWIAFLALNTPAYVVCLPLFSLFDLQTAPARYPLLFPVSVIWWWWLGRRIDLGLLPSRPFRHRWLASSGFALAAVGVSYATALIFLDDAQWWSGYHVGLGLRLLRTAGPRLWGFVIAVTLTLCAIRATRSNKAGR